MYHPIDVYQTSIPQEKLPYLYSIVIQVYDARYNIITGDLYGEPISRSFAYYAVSQATRSSYERLLSQVTRSNYERLQAYDDNRRSPQLTRTIDNKGSSAAYRSAGAPIAKRTVNAIPLSGEPRDDKLAEERNCAICFKEYKKGDTIAKAKCNEAYRMCFVGIV